MIKTGLFFGSFNPIHIGHLMIANYFYSFTDLDEIWLVVTPQNPWKRKQQLIEDNHRMNMVQLAIKNTKWLKASLFEKDLNAPHYTFKSLEFLRKNYPNRKFVLLIGGDNYQRFNEWKNADDILKHHEVWAFPRQNNVEENHTISGLKIFKAPQFEISSQMIRDSINDKKDMTYFLPHGINEYIVKHQLL